MACGFAFLLIPVLAFSMELKSPAFKTSDFIPKKHSCRGEDLSPALTWSHAPQGTKSFALIMDDPDAPAGVWVHWVVYDLPATSTGLPEGWAKNSPPTDGSQQGRSWGVDEFERTGYAGPCPPPGSLHRYSLRLYALDKVLGLSQASRAELLKAMKGHIIAQTELVGRFR